MGRPDGTSPHRPDERDENENPGYEIQDVNVGGITTFLAGLVGSVAVFFLVCFFLGKVINTQLVKDDGAPNKWNAQLSQAGATPRGEKREDLASNAEMGQRQLQQMSQAFPTPRLQTDDGNQDTADTHAREDLLLNYTSTGGDLPPGTVRIPIDRAMELIAQRGLPAPPAAAAPRTLMAGETAPTIQAPLTNGFARTGYELDTIETRRQKNEFNQAEAHR